MKIVEFSEVSNPILKQLKAAGLYPLTLTNEKGEKLTGYLLEEKENEDDLFWGVKIEKKKT